MTASDEAPVEAPVEALAEAPSEAPAEALAEAPVEAPSEGKWSPVALFEIHCLSTPAGRHTAEAGPEPPPPEALAPKASVEALEAQAEALAEALAKAPAEASAQALAEASAEALVEVPSEARAPATYANDVKRLPSTICWLARASGFSMPCKASASVLLSASVTLSMLFGQGIRHNPARTLSSVRDAPLATHKS